MAWVALNSPENLLSRRELPETLNDMINLMESGNAHPDVMNRYSGLQQQYNTSTKRIDTYESMLTELDNTADLKASMDLQSRINIENGIVLNELARTIAMQTQLLAAQNNQDLSNKREAFDINQ